jgi:hypothetical protein
MTKGRILWQTTRLSLIGAAALVIQQPSYQKPALVAMAACDSCKDDYNCGGEKTFADCKIVGGLCFNSNAKCKSGG